MADKQPARDTTVVMLGNSRGFEHGTKVKVTAERAAELVDANLAAYPDGKESAEK